MKDTTYYGIIYKFVNKINKKVYVGQTVDEDKRYKEHMLHNKKGDSPYFHKAIEKYGFDNFEYKVLYRVCCSNKQDFINTLNQKEISAIKFFNSHDSRFGYNLTEGGQGGRGRPVVSVFSGGTAFPVLKIDPTTGDILKKYKSILEATKDCAGYSGGGSISGVLRGKCYFAYGYFWKLDDGSEVTLPKIPDNYRGAPVSRAVYKIDSSSGDIIEEYSSINEACSSLGLTNHSSISNACSGKIKTAYGFIWKYKDSYDPDKHGPINLYNHKRWTDRMIRVAKYTLSGEFIRFFDSIEDAAKESGGDWSRITDSCKDLNSHHYSAGFLWRYEADALESIPAYEKLPTKITPVLQYTKDGEFIREYQSLSEAAISVKGAAKYSSIIYRSCKRNEDSLSSVSCGFMWKFKTKDDK